MAQGTARIGKDKYRTQISVGGRDIVADEPPALGGQGAGRGRGQQHVADIAADQCQRVIRQRRRCWRGEGARAEGGGAEGG